MATTQAAEKVYRAAAGGGHCAIDVAVRVAEGATLDWLPQETIVFQGARLKRRTVADVEPGGALLACEMVVLGRAASGERFVSGLLLDAWSVRRAGRLAWTDTLRIEGETPDGAGFGAANALATVIGVWDAPQPQLRESARAARDCRRGALGRHPGERRDGGPPAGRGDGGARRGHPLSHRFSRMPPAASLACLMQPPIVLRAISGGNDR